ncbi:MAG: MFS transporter [Thermoanaerobaculia bacterium]|jgi:PAT family beta-lactamase induction signal transducer AmpG
MSEPPGQLRAHRPLLLLIGSLYFAEGMPYGIVSELLPLYLRERGVPLAEIGFLGTIGLAWTLKFLWAPLVDGLGSYAGWMRGALVSVAAALMFIGFGGEAGSPLFWVAAAALALASATQDVAIDAIAVATSTPANVGIVNSTRIATYRVAIIVAGGGLAAIAGSWGWRVAFSAGAALSLACLASTLFIRHERVPRTTLSPIPALRRWLARPDMATILAVALLYKLGDSTLAHMIKPFWVDSGYGVAEIGTATTVIGIGCTIVGAIAGGLWVGKRGLGRALVELGVIQLASNATYAIAAATGAGRASMYTASVVENLAGGMGTAAFLSFLMTSCDREDPATEFALLTAIMGLSRSLAGTTSGLLAQSLGFVAFFWLTMALGVPGLVAAIRAKARATVS